MTTASASAPFPRVAPLTWGYLTAMWARPADRDDPMLELSAVTRRPGFPSRAALVEAYERESGQEARDLPWYQTLAI